MRFKKIMKYLFIILIALGVNSFSNQAFANIVYEKNNIIITDYDINIYKKYYFELFSLELNNFQIIKNIYLNKNLVIKFQKNNPSFFDNTDNEFLKNNSSNTTNIEVLKDFNRFLFLKNEIINDYISNRMSRQDLTEVMIILDKSKIQLSKNKCLTIEKIINLNELNNFDELYFDILKRNKIEFTTDYKNELYDICLDKKLKLDIEMALIKLIEKKTNKEFLEFIYK